MRSDNLSRHMKIHRKYTLEEVPENDICKEIILNQVDKVLYGNRSDVQIKYDEENVHETLGIKENIMKHLGQMKSLLGPK